MFIATDNPLKPLGRLDKEYRSLSSYGRQIFRVCVATIMTGSNIVKRLNLASLLVTNQQRLDRICQALSKSNVPSRERILACNQDIIDIDTYRYVAETGLKYDQLIGTAKLMIQQYLESSPIESIEFMDKMKKFIGLDSANHYDSLSIMKEIQEEFENHPKPGIPPSDPRIIVTSLLNSIWHYTFMYYFKLRNSSKSSPTSC